MELSIIVPAYNEEKRLPLCLEVLVAFCAKRSRESEIIVVVEKSTDETVSIATGAAAVQPMIQVIANPVQRGKGYALRTGVAHARGDFVVTMDADLSVPLEFLESFVEIMRDDPLVDVLVGNRQHSGSVIEVRQSVFRQTLGKTFNFCVRLLGVSSLKDTQCGFKVFRRKAARAIFSRQTIDGFACDVETLLLADRMGFVIRDLPVTWINSPHSRVRIVRDSFAMLVDLVRVRAIVRRTLAGKPFRKSELVASH